LTGSHYYKLTKTKRKKVITCITAKLPTQQQKSLN